MADASLPELDAARLLELRDNPPLAGRLAMQRRTALFGRRTLLRPTPSHPVPSGPALLRRDQLLDCPSSPEPGAWQPGDRVMLSVAPQDDRAAHRYVAWLLELAAARAPWDGSPLLGPCSLAPFCPSPAGTHRLWLIAAARLALPAGIRVEARHDLIGIRLAQVALGFGADTLAGPIEADRRLPIAGVTRPNEASVTGLRNLIEQAGLSCALQEDEAPLARRAGGQTTAQPSAAPEHEDQA